MRVPVYERREGIIPLPANNVSPLMPAGDGGTSMLEAAKGLTLKLQQMQNDTEDARTLELFNKFKRDSLEYHENPDKGLYNTRLGYHSQGVYGEADQWLRQTGEDYVKGLKSSRAKANFRKMAEQYIQQRGMQNSRFEADQMKKYQTEQADATIKNMLNYAEANWNNSKAVNEARQSIYQAMELKLRGSSKEAFQSAYNEVENQIGLARIRQAYVKDPLLAVRMLTHPDIRLNPKDKAQLAKTLGAQTEVYKIQAIAQAYSQHYTPENAMRARNDLINRYGADIGQKAFSALSHIWSIANFQDNAREQSTRKRQQRNEQAFYRRFIDPNQPDPTENEILSAMKDEGISLEFTNSSLNHIRSTKAAQEKEREKILQAQEKLRKETKEIELKVNSWDNKYLTDEELEQGIKNGDYNIETAEDHRRRREKYSQEQEQAKNNAIKDRQSQTADKYRNLILNGENFTKEQIITDVNNGDLDVKEANGFSNYLDAKQKNDVAAAQQALENAIEIAIDEGKDIPNSTINNLLRRGEISAEAAKHFRILNKQKKTERKQAKAEEEKQRKEADEKQQREDLDVQAKQIADAYRNETGNGLAYIEGLNIPLADKDFLRQRFNQYSSTKKQQETDRQTSLEEIRSNMFLNLKIAALRGEGLSREGNLNLLEENIIKPNQFNELEAIRMKQEEAQQKADNEIWKDRMLDTAKDLATRFPIGNENGAYDEINTMDRKDQEEVRKHYNRLISEQKVAQSNEDKQKQQQQENNYNNLISEYINNYKAVPNDVLQQYERDETISREQIEKIHVLNAALSTRAGVEELLRRDPKINFAELSPREQEAAIMEYMGTNEVKRKENFVELLIKYANGTATDAETDAWFILGKISSEDRERLKNFDSNFERRQKTIIHQVGARLLQDIRDLGIKKDPQRYINDARTLFYAAVDNLDPHAKNFTEALQSIYDSTFQYVSSQYANTMSKGRIFKNEWEKRMDTVLQDVATYEVPQQDPTVLYQPFGGEVMNMNESGDVSEWNNVVEMNEEPFIDNDISNYSNYLPIDNAASIKNTSYSQSETISDDTYFNEIPQDFNAPYYPQPNKQVRGNSKIINSRINQYENIINESSDKYGVEPELVKAVIHAESGGNKNAVSSAGAQGLMQLMPSTAKSLGVTDSFDAKQNIMGGVKYLAQLLRRYKGDIKKALWGYNAGPGNADKGRMPKPSETKPYINRIISIYNKLKGTTETTTTEIPPQPFSPIVRSSDQEVRDMLTTIFLFGGNNPLSNDIFTTTPYGGF